MVRLWDELEKPWHGGIDISIPKWYDYESRFCSIVGVFKIFQFQNGTIMSRFAFVLNLRNNLFQFQNGTIMRIVLD